MLVVARISLIFSSADPETIAGDGLSFGKLA
jgi:hypothetical protein